MVLLIAAGLNCDRKNGADDETFAAFTVDPKRENIEFFLRDDEGNYLKSLGNLKKYLEKKGRRLRFAMNGGMYEAGNQPLGLFIQNRETITPLNTREAEGNFYLKPNGVFYVATDGEAFVTRTEDFIDDGQLRFATQSGPLLLVDGEINHRFAEKSDNVHIRNGVCVTEQKRVIFAISKRPVTFYDFARFFKSMNCKNALYLDGFVSRMYLPERGAESLDGDFGVIIGISE